MKTAVSIPDLLFAEAERVARRLKLSRSRLYAVALESYVRAHEPSEVTKSLNRVYGRRKNRPDPAWDAIAAETLLRSKW
jgi:metal-responsive CopG/Arc/MetJ family transcriptional regulator